jgi:phosphopantothenate---cysteine ligase (CTP)
MKCLVTAGPTSEPLDAVRRLTNFSRGKLGSDLAAFLIERGHDVVLLRSTSAVYPAPFNVSEIIDFSTTADLQLQLSSFATQRVDAVFHAAAVSDFSFGRVFTRLATGDLQEVKAGKFSSRTESLYAELISTPKIIGQLREWFPGALLAGWKYETDGGPASVVALSQQQLIENRTDVCVMNGPAYGAGFGVLTKEGDSAHCATALALFNHLDRILAEQGQ